jgi:hypothetical protein
MVSNALEPTKRGLLNSIQVAAEVNAALRDNDLVVVEKQHTGQVPEQIIYNIYALKGTVEMMLRMPVDLGDQPVNPES